MKQKKKVAYNYNRSAERRYLRDAKEKQDTLNLMLKFTGEHVEVKDLDRFMNDPYGYYQELMRNKYGGKNFQFVGFEKLCELIDHDPKPLFDLAVKFKNNKITLDPKTLKPAPRDFHQYAEGQEQIERLMYAETIRDTWVDFKRRFPRASSMKFIQGFDGVLIPDYSNLNDVMINPLFVRGKAM